MTRCPSCGAHQDEDADYCPVCGETFPGPHLSEATGPPWYERTGLVLLLAVVVWPIALYALYERDAWDRNADQWLLGGTLVAAVTWALLLF